MEDLICCVIGHRFIKRTEELIQRLTELFIDLIENRKVSVFLFGSRSQFNDLCLEVITELRKRYPDINRVYVRAEYDYDDETMAYLLKYYEETYYCPEIKNAKSKAYVIRNRHMIDKSDICVFYYNGTDVILKRATKKVKAHLVNSGTKLALDYAKDKNKEIINVYDINHE